METYMRKYFFSALLLLAFALGVYVLWPFIQLIVLAGALAVVFYPVSKWLTRKTKMRGLSAFLTTVLFVLILCGPILVIGSIVAKQSESLTMWISNQGSVNVVITKMARSISHVIPVDVASVKTSLANATSNFSLRIGSLLTNTISTVFSLLLVVLSMFYFLKDGPVWKHTLTSLSPLSEGSDKKIIEKLRDAVNGIIKGRLLVGVAQGILMGLGLWVFGVPNAALWGVITIIASLIPSIGTGLIAGPAIIYLFAMGHNTAAIGLTLWGLLLVGLIDNVLNPYLVSRAVSIHPLLVLFSILGGLTMLGPIGLLTGPLIISFIYALTSVYKSEMA